MKYLYLLPIAALSFAACDSKTENERDASLEKKADALEDQADTTRNVTEKKADAIEDTKVGGDKLKLTTPQDNAANAVRDAGAAKADGLENTADAVRDQK